MDKITNLRRKMEKAAKAHSSNWKDKRTRNNQGFNCEEQVQTSTLPSST
jgi:hypothetical protein